MYHFYAYVFVFNFSVVLKCISCGIFVLHLCCRNELSQSFFDVLNGVTSRFESITFFFNIYFLYWGLRCIKLFFVIINMMIDHLQAKASWTQYTTGVGNDVNLPPGFEESHPANVLHNKLSEISVIQWQCPPKVSFNVKFLFVFSRY